MNRREVIAGVVTIAVVPTALVEAAPASLASTPYLTDPDNRWFLENTAGLPSLSERSLEQMCDDLLTSGVLAFRISATPTHIIYERIPFTAIYGSAGQ